MKRNPMLPTPLSFHFSSSVVLSSSPFLSNTGVLNASKCHKHFRTLQKGDIWNGNDLTRPSLPLYPTHPPSPIQMFPGLLSWLERLGLRLRRCWVCQESQRAGRAAECPSPGCLAVYCPGCWRDVDMFCYACTLVPHGQPEESCSDTDVHYDG